MQVAAPSVAIPLCVCVYLLLWDLTILSPAILSNKPLNFKHHLEFHPFDNIYYFKHSISFLKL